MGVAAGRADLSGMMVVMMPVVVRAVDLDRLRADC